MKEDLMKIMSEDNKCWKCPSCGAADDEPVIVHEAGCYVEQGLAAFARVIACALTSRGEPPNTAEGIEMKDGDTVVWCNDGRLVHYPAARDGEVIDAEVPPRNNDGHAYCQYGCVADGGPVATEKRGITPGSPFPGYDVCPQCGI